MWQRPRAMRAHQSSTYALEGRAALGPSSGLGELLLGAMRDEDAIVRAHAATVAARPPVCVHQEVRLRLLRAI